MPSALRAYIWLDEARVYTSRPLGPDHLPEEFVGRGPSLFSLKPEKHKMTFSDYANTLRSYARSIPQNQDRDEYLRLRGLAPMVPGYWLSSADTMLAQGDAQRVQTQIMDSHGRLTAALAATDQVLPMLRSSIPSEGTLSLAFSNNIEGTQGLEKAIDTWRKLTDFFVSFAEGDHGAQLVAVSSGSFEFRLKMDNKSLALVLTFISSLLGLTAAYQHHDKLYPGDSAKTKAPKEEAIEKVIEDLTEKHGWNTEHQGRAKHHAAMIFEHFERQGRIYVDGIPQGDELVDFARQLMEAETKFIETEREQRRLAPGDVDSSDPESSGTP